MLVESLTHLSHSSSSVCWEHAAVHVLPGSGWATAWSLVDAVGSKKERKVILNLNHIIEPAVT